MDKNKVRFIDAKEIMELTGLSKAAAYRLIQQLNEELVRKGYMTVRGRVIYPYFYERFFGKDGDADAGI
ncbi:MAG: helix-turn-helix transcriptional regulator [Floccifex porci]|uniref:helix-turn-helix transcriptional regulator n=1 Tax=Floccifex porci TaxID=2606629 RepID=UPI003EFDC068